MTPQSIVLLSKVTRLGTNRQQNMRRVPGIVTVQATRDLTEGMGFVMFGQLPVVARKGSRSPLARLRVCWARSTMRAAQTIGVIRLPHNEMVQYRTRMGS